MYETGYKEEVEINIAAFNTWEATLKQKLKIETRNDHRLNQLKRKIDIGEDRNNYKFHKGLLFSKNEKARKGWVLLISENCKQDILKIFHDRQGNPG